MLMAGLDGVINKIEPPDPVDVDLYEMLDTTAPTAVRRSRAPPAACEVLNALRA